MAWQFWLVVSILLLVFVLYSAFPVAMMYKAAEKSDIYLWPGMKTVARIWYVIGAPADVLFNWFLMTPVFREWPKEGTVTSRLKRHFRHSTGDDKELANKLSELPNFIDPGHVE